MSAVLAADGLTLPVAVGSGDTLHEDLVAHRRRWSGAMATVVQGTHGRATARRLMARTPIHDRDAILALEDALTDHGTVTLSGDLVSDAGEWYVQPGSVRRQDGPGEDHARLEVELVEVAP